jgi:hypothetical protein
MIQAKSAPGSRGRVRGSPPFGYSRFSRIAR